MGRMMLDASLNGSPMFEDRRKLRRVRMIVELTSALVGRDSSVTFREACSLVDCAEKAIIELMPHYRQSFELYVRPTFDRIIRERWPCEATAIPFHPGNELVN